MSIITLLFFPFAMVLAASTDLLTMKISNKLVLALVIGFFIVAIAINMSLQQLALHVLCALLVLTIGFVFFAMRWIGGGDAKLAAATTLWFGFETVTLQFVVYAGLLGGGLTLLILALRGTPLTPFIARYRWLERLHDPKSGVPYGMALAAAGMIVYVNSPIFQSLSA